MSAGLNRVAHLLRSADEAPTPTGPFTDTDALEMLMDYSKCPAHIRCPHCDLGVTRPDEQTHVQVIAFIEPRVDENNMATVVEPVGQYAAALACWSCGRHIGIKPPASN